MPDERTEYIKQVLVRPEPISIPDAGPVRGKIILSIRDNYYGSRPDKFSEMLEEARKDFPGKEVEYAEVHKFGGQSYKGTFGITFSVACDIDEVPACYDRYSFWHEFL